MPSVAMALTTSTGEKKTMLNADKRASSIAVTSKKMSGQLDI